MVMKTKEKMILLLKKAIAAALITPHPDLDEMVIPFLTKLYIGVLSSFEQLIEIWKDVASSFFFTTNPSLTFSGLFKV